MTKTAWKRVFPFVGFPVLELALWLFRRGADPAAMLLDGVLLAFGYFAAISDLRDKRVPNKLTGAMLGAWVLVLTPQLFYRTEYALMLLLSGGIGFLLAGVVFLIVYLVSRKGLGGGDVKLMAVSGLYLGVDVLPVMLYGSVFSAVTGFGLLLAKKIGRRDAIPLVPFLYVGMLIVIFTQS